MLLNVIKRFELNDTFRKETMKLAEIASHVCWIISWCKLEKQAVKRVILLLLPEIASHQC